MCVFILILNLLQCTLLHGLKSFGMERTFFIVSSVNHVLEGWTSHCSLENSSKNQSCPSNVEMKYSQFGDIHTQLYYLLHSAVPTLTINLTPNVTHLPNVTPYNTFFLTCTATSSVVGVRNVAIPKTFKWKRSYGHAEMNLMKLSSNNTIQITDGHNLNHSISTSMLTVTERIPHDYRYHCQVDLDLTTDNIFAKTDVYPITVSGKPP